ncbi:MAG: pseudaminic acid cytidylyltransferase [Lachnotalea sp.]
MSNIAIITARGGSKRIPRKNIKEFCGRPIIEYSIKAALDSNIFDEVMVSTDSEEIAEIACAAGAKVPFLRSEKTSDDFATTADVIMEVLQKYKEKGKTFTYACCIYPTAPFVTATKLNDGIKLLKKKSGNMVMPIVMFSFPPQRGMIYGGDGIKHKWPENKNLRSQDLEPIYHDCGQFYCYDVEKFISQKGQFINGIIPMIMPETQVQDIDNMDDWKIAELKYQLMNKF